MRPKLSQGYIALPSESSLPRALGEKTAKPPKKSDIAPGVDISAARIKKIEGRKGNAEWLQRPRSAGMARRVA